MRTINIFNAKLDILADRAPFPTAPVETTTSDVLRSVSSFSSDTNSASLMKSSISTTEFGNIAISDMGGRLVLMGRGFNINGNLANADGTVHVINDEFHKAIVVQSDNAVFSSRGNTLSQVDILDDGHTVILHKGTFDTSQIANYAEAAKDQLRLHLSQKAPPVSQGAVIDTTEPVEPVNVTPAISETPPQIANIEFGAARSALTGLPTDETVNLSIFSFSESACDLVVNASTHLMANDTVSGIINSSPRLFVPLGVVAIAGQQVILNQRLNKQMQALEKVYENGGTAGGNDAVRSAFACAKSVAHKCAAPFKPLVRKIATTRNDTAPK